MHEEKGTRMNQGLIAIIIVLFIIVASVKTRHCVECMLVGSLVAAVMAYGKDALVEWCNVLQQLFADNVWIFLVCALFGALIALLQESKGSFGFTKYIAKVCTNQKRTMLTTFIMGILIFVDDYLNVLSIGACMKKICDNKKLPRETLAFLLNSTGAPVCVLLPFSTWAVYFATLFYDQAAVRELGFTSAMDAYLHAIPFLFYPMFTLVMVFLFCMGWLPKIGPMKKAFQRVETTGKTYSDSSRRFNQEIEVPLSDDGNVWNFLIPMLTLVGVTIATSDILIAVVIALGVCFVLYVPRKIITVDDFMSVMIKGMGDMLPVLTMLLITFVLKEITGQMGMTDYIIDLAKPLLVPAVFPAMVFVLGAVLAFTTGSDWGMCAVITPIVFPLGAVIGANPVLIMAAIVSGGTFGSHACFYSDATLLASQSAGIDNLEHALSQLPYALMSCGMAVVAFVAAGFLI